MAGAPQDVHAGSKLRKGLKIGVGVGLGLLLLNEAAKAEKKQYRPRKRPQRSHSGSSTSRSSGPSRSSPRRSTISFSQDILEIQKSLNLAGYPAGPEDGLYGQQTKAAIRDFQRDEGYEVTGTLSPSQIQGLHSIAAKAVSDAYAQAQDQDAGSGAGGPSASDADAVATGDDSEAYPEEAIAASPEAEDTAPTESRDVPGHETTAKTVSSEPSGNEAVELEKMLIALDLMSGEADGEIDETTTKAIKEFQVYLGNEATGELTEKEKDELKSNYAIYTGA